MDEKLFIKKTGMSFGYYINQFKTRNIYYIQKYNIDMDIDDILQTYYIFLLNQIKYFDPNKSTFLTFNHLVLQTHLKLLYRKCSSVKNIPTVHFEVFPDDFEDEVEQTIENELELVYELLNTKIKQVDKNILLDRYLEGMSNKELCDKYNLKQQDVKNKLHNTIKKLNKLVKNGYIINNI